MGLATLSVLQECNPISRATTTTSLRLRYSLFLLHLIDKLGDLIIEFRKPTSYPEIKVLLTCFDAKSFAWMWDFFADPRETIALARQEFWEKVQEATVDEFYEVVMMDSILIERGSLR